MTAHLLHLWRRTEEYHPTTDPIWIWICSCGAIAEARETEAIDDEAITEADLRISDPAAWDRYLSQPTACFRRSWIE